VELGPREKVIDSRAKEQKPTLGRVWATTHGPNPASVGLRTIGKKGHERERGEKGVSKRGKGRIKLFPKAIGEKS